jgi:hypothetical protein
VRKEVVKADSPWISTAKRHENGGIDTWEPLKKTEEGISCAGETEKSEEESGVEKGLSLRIIGKNVRIAYKMAHLRGLSSGYVF